MSSHGFLVVQEDVGDEGCRFNLQEAEAVGYCWCWRLGTKKKPLAAKTVGIRLREKIKIGKSNKRAKV